MEYFLPNAIEAGRYKARQNAISKSKKLALHIGDEVIPVSDLHHNGFSVNKKYELPKRAHVEVFDGSRSLYVGMIHYAQEEANFQHFEFKRISPITAEAPKDYAAEETQIAGLITKR